MPDYKCKVCTFVHYNYSFPPTTCAHCGEWRGLVGAKPMEKKDGCGKRAALLFAGFVILSASVVAVLTAVF